MVNMLALVALTYSVAFSTVSAAPISNAPFANLMEILRRDSATPSPNEFGVAGFLQVGTSSKSPCSADSRSNSGTFNGLSLDYDIPASNPKMAQNVYQVITATHSTPFYLVKASQEPPPGGGNENSTMTTADNTKSTLVNIQLPMLNDETMQPDRYCLTYPLAKNGPDPSLAMEKCGEADFNSKSQAFEYSRDSGTLSPKTTAENSSTDNNDIDQFTILPVGEPSLDGGDSNKNGLNICFVPSDRYYKDTLEISSL